jgi:threonine dehydrogenase-like Zn-dependent dehydrogenase
MLAARIALRSGVQPILVDPVQPRLELARQLQIARVINPFAAHLGDDLLYATGGEQADAVIDTAGSEDALAPLADAVAPETPVAICAADPHSSIPTSAILRKRLTVYGAQPRRDDYREALQLMPRLHSDLRALVSSRVELSVVPETIALAARNRESYLKLLVRP